MADKPSASDRIAQLREQGKKGVQILKVMYEEGYTMKETNDVLYGLGYFLHPEVGEGHVILHVSDTALEAGLAVIVIAQAPLTLPAYTWPTTARAAES